MLKRNKELQELVKKQKEEEKKIKTTVTPKATAVPTSQNSNLVGGVSINNASMMENSRLRRNEAPKAKTNLLRSEAPKTTVSETFNSEGYANTGKKYGDYYYNNYSQLKDVPIYKDKNGKYYTYYNNKYDLLGTGITGSTMTSKSEQKRQLEEAKKLGFKEQQREKTKEYKKAEKAFSKLQKEYNLTDDELNQYIKSGKLSYKGLKTNLITKSMTDARETANTYRQMLDKGSIKKYENNSLLTAEQRLDLATNNLTKSQKSEFKEDLIRQNKKANSGYNDKSKYGYDGTLSGTIKALGSTINNVGDTLNKNIVEPMNNWKDYYEYGKKQNDLAIEYYKKMENKKNNAEAKQKEMDLYQKFNQDLMTDKSWGAEALRNANTQVESLKRQGIVATASSIAGGLAGTAINPGAGTMAGAKIGGSIGYTLGSTPYTYKLEAGNQYQALTEMGVPDKIAKKYSRVTGGINAAIESGENVVDLITWGVGTKGSNAVSKEAVNKLVKDYGKEQVEEWANKGASKVAKTAIKSYLQNIGTEALEETSQEATSILGERLAAKESGIKRDVSLKEDLSRALEAGKSAAVSTALTAPISSIGGTLNTNMMNQIETKVNSKINNKTINNNNITTEETQINKQQDNIIDTPQEVKQEVQQEIKEEVQEQPTIPVEKMNEILNDVVKKSDVEFTQEEISELRESMYKQVEKLGAKVEESVENKQEIKEQNNNNLKLEQRVSGDKLLNAQDLIDEVKSVGAKVDDNGYITLYHQTTPEAAQKIKETGKMISKEKDIFFSTSKDAQQSNGRGNEKLEFKIPAENLVLDDLFSDNADLKISLDGKNELDVSNYIVNNNSNNSIKQKQLDIVKDSNPMQDDYHTGIRTIEDIKTLEETLNDSDYEGYDEFNPDLTRQDIENAIKKGTIMVYSSYPIENGVFVSPSKMEAESYSGNGKVYSKEVSINDVAWIDPTQGQYAKVQNDTLNFKQTKGNIPINEKLLNKYNNVKEMMNSEINNYDGKVDVKDINQINELKDVDLSTLNKTDVFNLAKNIFDRYNNKNLFNNNGNEIMVSHADIKESIKHIYNENQIKYLKEHLQVFSDLGDIIESATLSSQGLENKKNMQSTHSHNNIWSYYLNGLKINGETYLLEFDVVSRDNGENHYRVQRIQKTDTSAGNTVNNSITPTLEASASINNDTTKPNKSQIAPSQNSMQQNEKNTPKEKNTIEEKIEKEKVPNTIMVKGNELSKGAESLNDNQVAEILTEYKEQPKGSKRKIMAMLKAAVVDKGAVFEDLSIKNKNKELMAKWDYMLTSEARGQNTLVNGHYEYDPSTKQQKQTSKSLNSIQQEVINNGLTKELYEYMYHQLNIDRMTLEDRFENQTNKPVFGKSINANESRKIVHKLEQEHPELIDYAKDIYDYLKADKKKLVESGIIDEETSELWDKMYPHYVPISRVDKNGKKIKDVPLFMKREGINSPVKSATGGNSSIQPLFETIASRTLQTEKAISKNNFGLELKNTLKGKETKIETDVNDVINSIDTNNELLQKGTNGSSPTLTIFENGEKITFDITPDMYYALEPLGDKLINKTFKAPNKFMAFQRGVLTEYNPLFMITNSIKDAQDVLINSKHPAKTYSKFLEAYKQIIKKGYWYKEYTQNGGEHNSYFDNANKKFEQQNNNKIKSTLKLPLTAISKANNVIEMAPRLAEYIVSRENGQSIESSMLDAARVTTNFKAGGDVTKFMNRNGFTFLNASVQGAAQQIRNIREANMQGMKGYVKLATKFTIASLPALLLNGLIWKDDDDYEELSDYVKQNYYIVGKYGKNNFIRIPKGRMVAVIQDAITQVMNKSTGKDELDFQRFFKSVMDNIAPNNPLENNILSPITQAISNKTWYGEDLVPQRLKTSPKKEQYDESTDSFSKWLGEKINVSPYKINYILDQYSGGIGDVLLPMSTPKAESGDNSLLGKMLAPTKSKFTTDSTFNNQNVADYYKLKDKLTEKAKSQDATEKDKLRSKYINSKNYYINQLYSEKRTVQNSKLNDKKKYKQVKEIQQEIVDMTKEVKENYNKITVSGDYATVGDLSYKKDKNGDWIKVRS